MTSTQIFLRVLSVICMLISLCFIGFGIYTMYTYGLYIEGDYGGGAGDKTGHIVGGDAYNFIIIACRGTGLVCAGVGFAVIGCIFAIFSVSHISKKNLERETRTEPSGEKV